MRKSARVLPAFIALAVAMAAAAALTPSCSKGPVLEEPAHGESILDRVERVSGLVLLGASPQVKADLGPSRQGEFITEAEKNRLATPFKRIENHSLD